MNNNRGSEWNRWDLHLHTASSYDYKYKADDADELLCKTLKANEIKAVAITDHFKIDKCRIEVLHQKLFSFLELNFVQIKELIICI